MSSKPKRTRLKRSISSRQKNSDTIKIVASNGTPFNDRVNNDSPPASEVSGITESELVAGEGPSKTNSIEDSGDSSDGSSDSVSRQLEKNSNSPSSNEDDNDSEQPKSSEAGDGSGVTDPEPANSDNSSSSDSESEVEVAEEKNSNSSKGRMKNQYSVDLKLKIIDQAKISSNREAARYLTHF